MAREIVHNASGYRGAAPRPGDGWESPTRGPLAFHRRLPGYQPSPLVDVPNLAEVLGIARVWVKDESARFGLPAFKVLGASWAAYRVVTRAAAEALGSAPAGWTDWNDWEDLSELRAALAPLRSLTLLAATAGNHGRAVARVARWLGLNARILVPAGTAGARLEALRAEGAEVVVVDGSYDDAVTQAAGAADEEGILLVSDTSWPGYEEVPRRVIDGYSTLFWEIDDAMDGWPDVVLVPVGVGALAAAAVRHYRQPRDGPTPVIIGVEPLAAAGTLASLRAGQRTSAPPPYDSIMAGLNAGTPSLVAWPYLESGLDAAVAIGDERAREAMRALSRIGIVAGETGAAALGALTELRRGHDGEFPIDPAARALVLCTEGATDPDAYERIVGHPPR